ncbi:MAG: YceI family protein [Longimicrobiales bacterium]|nr:YceI family protein [Longimicrobiales bacterium]
MSANLWKIDPAHTQIEFSVKHMMFTTVRGQFGEFEGAVELDTDNPAESSVSVTIDASSIDTGVSDRDEHLRSGDFFDVENHPEISFTSKRVSGPIEEGGDFEIVGDLTIRGVTKEVTLDATFDGTGTDPWGGTRAGFGAETKIDRRDFDLTWNQALETGGVLVGHDVKISLQVQAVLQEEEAAVAV